MRSLVTQSDGSVRHQPWITYALGTVLLVAFAALAPQLRAGDIERNTAVADAVAYFEQHPYLEPGSTVVEAIGLERAAELRLSGAAGPSERAIGLAQRRLDALSGLAEVTIADHPAAAYSLAGDAEFDIHSLANPFVHASLLALGLSLLVLAGVAIPLEDAWGPLAFGAFAALALALGAAAAAFAHPDLTPPWLGASGLAAALLGAGLVRGISQGTPRLLGGVPLPAWAILPAWLVGEYVLVRGAGPHSLDALPLVAHGSLLAFGALTAAGLRHSGLDRQIAKPGAAATPRSPNYERAVALREAGQAREAFALLEAEVAERRGDARLALAFWDVACELERTEEAVSAVLGVVRDALGRGALEDAQHTWLELEESGRRLDSEPTALLRIADGFLRAGASEPAMRALAAAVDSSEGLPPGLAARAARMAQSHDVRISRRAARAAIADEALGAAERETMHAILDAPGERAPLPDPPIVADAPPPPEPAAMAPAAPSPPVVAPEEPTAVASADPEVREPDELFDDSGLSEEAIGESRAADPLAVRRWNSPGLVEDLSGQLPDDLESFSAEQVELAPEATTAVDELVRDDTETTDTVEPEPEPEPEPEDEEATAPDLPEVGLAPEQPPEESTAPVLQAGGNAQIAHAQPAQLRPLRCVPGVPRSLQAGALDLETEGHGKTRLPLARVEALGVGAVSGLSARTVIVVDLVLNWLAPREEPLRVIRVRSDAFDPRKLVPGQADSVEALRALLGAIACGEQVRCLPGEGAAHGEPFAQFASLEDYERDVLQARASAHY